MPKGRIFGAKIKKCTIDSFTENNPPSSVPFSLSSQGVCDRDGIALNIRDLMQPWLSRPKFPVLRVRVVGSSLAITQQPYSFFSLSQRDATSGADSTTTAEIGRRACEEGAKGGKGDDAGARSPKLPRTGTPVPSGRPREGTTSAVDLQVCGAAEVAGSAERSQPAPAAWPVPLRIRAATGSRSVSHGAPASAVESREGGRDGKSNGQQPGEDTRSVLLTETSTSVVLPSLSCDSAADGSGEGAISAERVGNSENGGGNQETGRERRPYLVVNDGHSGFFTVQYECERSWELALAAVEEGVLNECETMGFVHDLILPLHEGVLIDRRAASLSISSREESCDGGGEDSSCDVTCLFSRLKRVVQLLGRNRGHPAWPTGQLFIWELLIMCASEELGEIYELSRGEFVLAQKCEQGSCERRNVSPAAATRSVAGQLTEDGGDTGRGRAAGSSPTAHQRTGSTNTPRTETHSGQTDKAFETEDSCVGVFEEKSTAAATDARSAMEGRITAAAQRLRSITADVGLASAKAEEHVRWHADRVASGVQQASEALRSLQEMRDRLERSRAQLAWARQNGVLEAVL